MVYTHASHLHQVPQDWSKPEGPKFALAVTKLPSRYPAGDSRYGGPIVYNPVGLDLRRSERNVY